MGRVSGVQAFFCRVRVTFGLEELDFIILNIRERKGFFNLGGSGENLRIERNFIADGVIIKVTGDLIKGHVITNTTRVGL